MLLEKSQIRSIIYYEWKQGTNAAQCFRKMCETLGEDIVKQRTVQNWYIKFKSGDFDLEDKERSGRPNEFENEAVVNVLASNPSATAEDIADSLNCTARTIRYRLQKMGYTCKLDKWVPYQLSDFNKINRVFACKRLLEKNRMEPFLDRMVTCDEKWVYYDNSSRKKSWSAPAESAQTVAKRGLTNKKVLLCVWWDMRGIIYSEFLKSGQTIDSNIYCDQLDKVNANLKKNRPFLVNRKGILFHQDNARPHVAVNTVLKLKELDWDLMEHPPYSPDIAPSDFYLFRCLQNHLDGAKFQSAEEVKKEVLEFFDSKSPYFFKEGIYKLEKRWEMVISSNGNYFD
jgi:histone-lysine N-methyltransferase SETMAR